MPATGFWQLRSPCLFFLVEVQVLWDEDAEANYLWNGKTLVSYESPEAIRRKCEFVREKKLRGIMYWEHGNDPTRELLGVIADTLGK